MPTGDPPAALSMPPTYALMYEVHSIVCIFASTPTCASWAWTTVAISLGAIMPEHDSGTRNTVENPLGRPASVSRLLAFCGSYEYWGTLLVAVGVFRSGNECGTDATLACMAVV